MKQKNLPENSRQESRITYLAASYFHMGKPQTIIGAERFHFRVRNGIGWFPLAMTARRNLLGGKRSPSIKRSTNRHKRIIGKLPSA